MGLILTNYNTIFKFYTKNIYNTTYNIWIVNQIFSSELSNYSEVK